MVNVEPQPIIWTRETPWRQGSVLSEHALQYFPDGFVRRLRKAKADLKLAKVLERHGDAISFVYFDVDGGRHLEHDEGDPYNLNIVLVFPPGADADVSAENAELVVAEVEEAVGGRLMGGLTVTNRGHRGCRLG